MKLSLFMSIWIIIGCVLGLCGINYLYKKCDFLEAEKKKADRLFLITCVFVIVGWPYWMIKNIISKRKD